MLVLGIDPGNEASGWAAWDSQKNRVAASAQETTGKRRGATSNDLLLQWLRDPCATSSIGLPAPKCFRFLGLICIEQIVIYQMADRQVHDTILAYGRMIECVEWRGLPWSLHDRSTIKSHLCPGVRKPKDANVNAAVRDRVGEKGTQKEPGPTYGLKGHSWQALGVALYGYDAWVLTEGVKARVA